jgi:hypothetical protein
MNLPSRKTRINKDGNEGGKGEKGNKNTNRKREEKGK